MRVILVTYTDKLASTFAILNPKIKYAAVVVDEHEPAKKIVERNGFSAQIIYPFYELKDCIENVYCDCLICVSDWQRGWLTLSTELRKYKFPKNKFVHLTAIDTAENFLLERALRYYREHAGDFEMFATGMSYVEVGLHPKKFKRRLFNFGRANQDLYYDYQMARAVVAADKNAGSRSFYALIGLSPYSFHYDLSQLYGENLRVLQYCVALNDLHNFWLPLEKYRNLFREDYLATKLSFEHYDKNCVNPIVPTLKLMDYRDRIFSRHRIDTWKDRNFPATRDENVKILDNYLNLCDENKIRAVMFLPPMSAGFIKHFSRQKMDEFRYFVGEALDRHRAAIFLDSWKLGGFGDENFCDVEHLNIRGAMKFSAILNDVVEQLDKGAIR